MPMQLHIKLHTHASPEDLPASSEERFRAALKSRCVARAQPFSSLVSGEWNERKQGVHNCVEGVDLQETSMSAHMAPVPNGNGFAGLSMGSDHCTLAQTADHVLMPVSAVLLSFLQPR